MLNSKQERELAYLVRIDNITPIEGYDRVELAHVGGWTIVVGKEDLCTGDLAIYFEIDSQVPEVEPFSSMDFLIKKHFKIKTQKMCKSISQGMICPISAFKQYSQLDEDSIINNETKEIHTVDTDTRFLTNELNVTYATLEDNIRKSSGKKISKYQKMLNKHPELYKNPITRFIYKFKLGKIILYTVYGKDVREYSWPEWVTKSDEERIQNCKYILDDKSPWIVTEKIDGTSTTFTLKQNGRKRDYFVCSRNVCFGPNNSKSQNDRCYYESNVYKEMSEKYKIEEFLNWYMDEFNVSWVTLQGETYGEGIQKRTYSINEHNFAGFNLIDSLHGRYNSVVASKICEPYGIPWVPILDKRYILPDTVEEVLAYAKGKSVLDDLPREGIVFRSFDAKKSFKAVSNEYLLKYHQ